jgi:hypothetical protein
LLAGLGFLVAIGNEQGAVRLMLRVIGGTAGQCVSGSPSFEEGKKKGFHAETAEEREAQRCPARGEAAG